MSLRPVLVRVTRPGPDSQPADTRQCSACQKPQAHHRCLYCPHCPSQQAPHGQQGPAGRQLESPRGWRAELEGEIRLVIKLSINVKGRSELCSRGEAGFASLCVWEKQAPPLPSPAGPSMGHGAPRFTGAVPSGTLCEAPFRGKPYASAPPALGPSLGTSTTGPRERLGQARGSHGAEGLLQGRGAAVSWLTQDGSRIEAPRSPRSPQTPPHSARAASEPLTAESGSEMDTGLVPQGRRLSQSWQVAVRLDRPGLQPAPGPKG